jgi:peptidoglycan LD-endopeptidase LytH
MASCGIGTLVYCVVAAAQADPALRSHTTDSAASERASELAWPPRLLIPVEGVAARDLRDTFAERRGRNQRLHEAIDILAPTGTRVFAVDDGRVARLFSSNRGGTTVYQFDRTERLVYYYAHLDRYAPGLTEGQQVRRGSLIGYVGATGNSRLDAPHLHFAIFRLGPQKQWWQGEPINPFPYLGGHAPVRLSCARRSALSRRLSPRRVLNLSVNITVASASQ